MTLKPRLHKQREDFAHNYKPVRVKCPECMRLVKGSNHVRVYKNLAGLWRHIKLEHGIISNLETNMNQIKQVLRNMSIAVYLGMISDG